jgi:hypothetical protein
MASMVENVAGDSDFPSLTQWLMANTKDKEVRELGCPLVAREVTNGGTALATPSTHATDDAPPALLSHAHARTWCCAHSSPS